jgi:phosphoesterase RecJ-like protein
MINETDFQKAVELIDESTNVLITTHTKPDGDACGCVVAISEVLSTLGKKTKTVTLSEVPEWYHFLFEQTPPILGQDITLEQLKAEDFDLVVLLDVNSNNQLPNLGDFLKQNTKPVLVIDHHATDDGLGDVELVDNTAAATALIVLDLLKHAGWKITKKIAKSLFVSIATDTGWFHFRNTDSRVFKVSAELIVLGVDAPQLYSDLYLNLSPQRFKLMAKMLNTLELHFDGRFATQSITQKDFQQAGAAFKDTENLIDECRRLGSVEVAALFVEMPNGQIKCSLRSTSNLDVCKIAQSFSGGGHKNAAGANLPPPLSDAKQLVLNAVQEQIARIGSK